jgi:hypothetical protein
VTLYIHSAGRPVLQGFFIFIFDKTLCIVSNYAGTVIKFFCYQYLREDSSFFALYFILTN